MHSRKGWVRVSDTKIDLLVGFNTDCDHDNIVQSCQRRLLEEEVVPPGFQRSEGDGEPGASQAEGRLWAHMHLTSVSVQGLAFLVPNKI